MPEQQAEPEGGYTMLTFEQAAARLVADGHVRRMTGEGLRKAAREHPDWPVSEEQYGKASNARTLPYELAVRFVQTRRRGVKKDTAE
ncbi:hypothetical protein [Streptomyces sp. NPDC005732]|uniref:hypothetical protein n=1 Tax=Streptomyces sp. NPDC005732 TaxID=3157057 RepID=UPI0033E32AA8